MPAGPTARMAVPLLERRVYKQALKPVEKPLDANFRTYFSFFISFFFSEKRKENEMKEEEQKGHGPFFNRLLGQFNGPARWSLYPG